jgi:hypothetical protein
MAVNGRCCMAVAVYLLLLGNLWFAGCSPRSITPGPDRTRDQGASVLWTRVFGGPARDVGGSIAEAAGDGWLVVGSTRSFGDGSDAIWLIRLDQHGDTGWTRVIGAPPRMRTATMSVAPARDGWMIGGQQHVAGDNHDIVLIAVDSNGLQQWTRTYGGDGYDHFEVIVRSSDGGYVVGGGHTPPGYGHDVPWLLRLDSRGDTLWTRVFAGPGFGHVEAVVEGADGGFVAALGVDERPGEYPIDLKVVKLDDGGRTVWTWRYGGPEIAVWPEWIERLPEGGYLVVGPICEPCSPRQPNYQTHFDAFVVRLAENGDTLWTRRIGNGAGNDLAYFATLTSRGTYMIAGAATPPGGSVDTPWLVEVSPSGDVVFSWMLERRFSRNGVAQVREVASDEFLVTGPPWLYQRDGTQDLWVVLLRR